MRQHSRSCRAPGPAWHPTPGLRCSCRSLGAAAAAWRPGGQQGAGTRSAWTTALHRCGGGASVGPERLWVRGVGAGEGGVTHTALTMLTQQQPELVTLAVFRDPPHMCWCARLQVAFAAVCRLPGLCHFGQCDLRLTASRPSAHGPAVLRNDLASPNTGVAHHTAARVSTLPRGQCCAPSPPSSPRCVLQVSVSRRKEVCGLASMVRAFHMADVGEEDTVFDCRSFLL